MTTRTLSITCPKGLKAFGGENGHPKYRENQEAARHKGQYVDETACCALCGRKSLGGKTFVLLSDMSEYITKEEYVENGDLGQYPIGSDCLKILKKAGVPIYNAEGALV